MTPEMDNAAQEDEETRDAKALARGIDFLNDLCDQKDAEIARLKAERDAMVDRVAELGPPAARKMLSVAAERDRAIAEAARMRAVLRRLVRGIDDWNDAVQRITGKVPDYNWGALEDARAALLPTTPEEAKR